MSTEPKTIRKKRASPDATPSNPAPEGDHRKRRRNRTTQSCLNCHTSKRMCDRKRPCGRCTQLGLTGLCVYEVDNPNRRSSSLDESSRLRQRVAELEGVIREMKNKPHPRWAKSGSSLGEEFEKCHARGRSPCVSEESVVKSRNQFDLSDLSAVANVDPGELPPKKQTASLVRETLQPEYLPSSFSPPSTESSASLSALPFSPYFDSPSSMSTPATGIVTPAEPEEHPEIQITVGGDQQLVNDLDLASFFMSYPELLACDESPAHVDQISQQFDPCSMKCHYTQPLDHCGCLNEAAGYNAILELSLRLRKAAGILSHVATHRFNKLGCPLNQKIVDLDSFATTALGNITTSPNDFGSVNRVCSRANTASTGPVSSTFSASSCIPSVCAPVPFPSTLHGFRSWNEASCTPNAPAPRDESFMTWELSHRI